MRSLFLQGLKHDWKKKMLLRRSFQAAFHAAPTQRLGFCMSDRVCRGEYLKRVVLEEGESPEFQKSVPVKREEEFFPAGSYLWGDSKSGAGLTAGEKYSATGRFLHPRGGNLRFIFAFIADTRRGGIPAFDLEHSLPAKHRKILLKFIFWPSFHFALMFLCLSSVPGYRESSRDINIDADLGY